jgi:hypothetical protein
VVIGAGAFWRLNYVQRRENSIAYHKAEYLTARDGRPIMNDLRDLWGRITGRRHRHRMSGDKLTVHGDALLRLGYWREETVILSNRSALDVRKAAIPKTSRPPLTKEIAVVSVTASNTLVVRAVHDHLPIWVGIYREADVPVNGEPR